MPQGWPLWWNGATPRVEPWWTPSQPMDVTTWLWVASQPDQLLSCELAFLYQTEQTFLNLVCQLFLSVFIMLFCCNYTCPKSLTYTTSSAHLFYQRGSSGYVIPPVLLHFYKCIWVALDCSLRSGAHSSFMPDMPTCFVIAENSQAFLISRFFVTLSK
jgi:hypothetical protein